MKKLINLTFHWLLSPVFTHVVQDKYHSSEKKVEPVNFLDKEYSREKKEKMEYHG